jgi:dTMP kinase
MSAKVIEFEGIDGSGKTTAYNYLIAQLRAQGKRVLDTREVGNPHLPVCVALRKIVLDPVSKMDGTAMEFVFAAMRIENQRFYETVKDQYDFIVSDRGWLSHLAYTDHNVSSAFTDNFYTGVVSKITRKPDMVVFLKLDPEVALKRRNARNGFVDAIEAKGPAFQEKVYNSFIKYLELENLTHASIDASQSIEGVQEQLNYLVKSTPIYNWSNF